MIATALLTAVFAAPIPFQRRGLDTAANPTVDEALSKPTDANLNRGLPPVAVEEALSKPTDANNFNRGLPPLVQSNDDALAVEPTRSTISQDDALHCLQKSSSTASYTSCVMNKGLNDPRAVHLATGCFHQANNKFGHDSEKLVEYYLDAMTTQKLIDSFNSTITRGDALNCLQKSSSGTKAYESCVREKGMNDPRAIHLATGCFHQANNKFGHDSKKLVEYYLDAMTTQNLIAN
jgi:hypothetical protein